MNVKPYDMQHDVIIACDFKSAEDTFKFLDLFRGEARKPFLKIGMELFYAEGPEIVREIKRRGHKIFLDLKLHDIPNTVKKAMAVLSRLDVDMCNVHAAGTIEMMKYALEGLTREDGTRPLLIAVTQLTSTSEERMQQELLIASSIGDTIVKYAQNTKAARRSKRAWYTKPAEKSSSQSRPACVLQTVTWRIRCVSPRLPVRGRSAPTSSSWDARSPPRPTLWLPIAVVWTNSADNPRSYF